LTIDEKGVDYFTVEDYEYGEGILHVDFVEKHPKLKFKNKVNGDIVTGKELMVINSDFRHTLPGYLPDEELQKLPQQEHMRIIMSWQFKTTKFWRTWTLKNKRSDLMNPKAYLISKGIDVTKEGSYKLKSDVEGFMDLEVLISKINEKGKPILVSMGHYVKQNGDRMSDPHIKFYIKKRP